MQFDPTCMRHGSKGRKPYPGTRVYLTTGASLGMKGIVQEAPQSTVAVAVKRDDGKLVFVYSHNLIELLGPAADQPTIL